MSIFDKYLFLGIDFEIIMVDLHVDFNASCGN